MDASNEIISAPIEVRDIPAEISDALAHRLPVIQSLHRESKHHVIINGDSSNMFEHRGGFPAPEMGIVFNGLRMVGVERRRLLKPHFLEINAAEVRRGDRLVMEDPDGQRRLTGRVNRLRLGEAALVAD